MKISCKVEGLKGLDASLQELLAVGSSRQGKAALKRGLVKAAQPMAQRMRSNAPERSGKLAGSILVKDDGVRARGNFAFGAVLQAGGDRGAALGAMRAAQREGASVEVHIGPSKKYSAIASITEFGAAPHVIRPKGGKGHKYVEIWQGGAIVAVSKEVHHPGVAPMAWMRQAFEATKFEVLDRFKDEAAAELQKAIERAKAKAARLGKA